MNNHICPECNRRHLGKIGDDMECMYCGYENTCHDCYKPKPWGYICTCDMHISEQEIEPTIPRAPIGPEIQ